MKNLLLLAMICGILSAQQPDPLRKKFEESVNSIVETSNAVVGVAIKNIATGEHLFINENEIFPQASCIKIHILTEVYEQAAEGRFSLSDIKPFPSSVAVGGSGILHAVADGTGSMSIRDYCVLMMVLSDNSATNFLINLVGMDNVNATLKENGAGNTKLQRLMMDYEAAKAGRENISTPNDVMHILEKLYNGELVNKQASADMLSIMEIEKDGWLKEGIDPTVPIANKAGDVEGVRCDVGIVLLKDSPYIICVMTKLLEHDEDGTAIIRDISRETYEYFERKVHSNEYGRRIPQ